MNYTVIIKDKMGTCVISISKKTDNKRFNFYLKADVLKWQWFIPWFHWNVNPLDKDFFIDVLHP